MSAAAVPDETTGSGREASLQAWRESQRAMKRTRKVVDDVNAQTERARQVYAANHFTEKLRHLIRGTGAA